MIILALDLATNTGWAHSSGISGVWSLKPKKDESDGIRVIKLGQRIKWVKKSLGIDLLVYEAARHGGISSRGLVTHAELQGLVKHLSDGLIYQYRGYSPMTIKKFATGNGRADKKAMIAAAVKLTGKNVTDDNEADALCLLLLAKQDFP